MSFIGALLGRLFGSVALSATKSKIFQIPDLNGSWVYEQVTTQSSYKPYLGMTLRYLVLLSINGNNVSGTAEKIWENSLTGGNREYVGKNRSAATITGSISSSLFGKTKLVINLDENGHGRKYSTQHILEVVDSNSLSGRFSSTAANQIGTCSWIKRST